MVLPSIRSAELKISDAHMNHEYLKQDGLDDFNMASQKLMFGEDSSVVKDGNCFTIQSISGTGAIRLGLELIKGTCQT